MYIVATSQAEKKEKKKGNFSRHFEKKKTRNGLKRPRITKYAIWRFHRLLNKKNERLLSVAAFDSILWNLVSGLRVYGLCSTFVSRLRRRC